MILSINNKLHCKGLNLLVPALKTNEMIKKFAN